MKLLLSFFLLISIVFTPELVKSQNNPEKPNIILIMADDMGFSDIGCYGGEIETPNIDKLAANGVRFKEFYNSARCCPTRASLITGLYPHQTGIGHMTNTPNNPVEHNYGYPGYQGYLNQNCITIAEMLKQNGYSTLMTGKWHLGFHGEEKWPLQRGFEKYYGIIAGASNYFKPEAPRGLTLGNKPVEPDENYYTTDAFTENAIHFIKESEPDEKPFFLYLAYTSPHWPLNAIQKDIDKYKGKYSDGWAKIREQRLAKMKDIGLLDQSVELSEQAGPDWKELSEEQKIEMDLRMAIYAAQIDRMDQNIGKLIESLEESGKLENTVIFFLSDNGGCAEGGMFGGGDKEELESKKGYFLTYGQAWANASNTPFKMYKHWVHEGGISTPLVVHWPAGIQKSMNGKWIDQFGFSPDIVASIQQITNTIYPEEYKNNPIQPLVGKSLFPAIYENKEIHKNAIFWEHEGNCAVRENQYKLVKKYGEDWELYNLETDKAESNNLVKQFPEKTQNLIKKYNEWASSTNVIDWEIIQNKIH